MEIQARSVDPASRKACQDKCKSYKSSLKSLKGDLDRLSEETDRADLMAGGAGGDNVSTHALYV
jgi:hypothetical protein